MQTELDSLRGYVQGVRDANPQAVQQQQQQPQQAEALPQQAVPAPATPFPMLEQHCAKCHTGAEPKGDFSIEQLDDQKVGAILRKTYNDQMPQDADGNPHPLDDVTFNKLMHEVLYEEPLGVDAGQSAAYKLSRVSPQRKEITK